MPLTTRRLPRMLAAVLLGAGVAASALPAAAAVGGDTPGGSTRPASVALTPGSGPVSAAIVVPFTLPPGTAGLVTADVLAQTTGSFGVLTRKLDAVAGTPVAIALDPMLLASIRVLGASAPPSATQWLARLQATSNEVFLLAYADADVTAAARTGTLDALQPTGFDFALDPDDFSGGPTETPAASATAEPDPTAKPPYPTTEELLAWSSTLPRIAWPGAAIGDDDLAALASAGFADVLVSSEAVGDPASPLVTLDGIQGIVADSTLSKLLTNAADAAAPPARTTALDALDAALAAETAGHPGRGVVLTLGADRTAGLPGLADAIARFETSGAAQLVPLRDILTAAPVPAQLGGGTATAERDAAFTALAHDASSEAAFSSVLQDPAQLLDPRRLARIALYSLSWEADATGWTDAVDAFRTRSGEILSSVRIERGSDVALLARNANVKVQVSNALGLPVTVEVAIDPLSPILRAGDPVELTIEPESTSTTQLPVEAIANGDATVQITLTSPSGVPIDSSNGRVTVRAEWEGIGTLAVFVVLALVFAAGLLRLVITRRRARAQADAREGDG